MKPSDVSVPQVLRLVETARALVDFGPSNRTGDKYAAKRAALDALDDATEVIEDAVAAARREAAAEHYAVNLAFCNCGSRLIGGHLERWSA